MTTFESAEMEAELRAIFADEGNELLARLERALVLAEHAEGEERAQLLRKTLRDLHTLKGAAGAIGITPIKRVCHRLEETLADNLDGDGDLSAELLDVCHRAITFMEGCVAGQKTEPLEEILDVIGAQDIILGGDDTPEEPASEPEEPAQPASPPQRPRPDVNLGGFPSGQSSIRVASQKLDDLQAAASELVVLKLQQEGSRKRVDRLRDGLAVVLSEWRALSGELREVQNAIEGRKWRRLQRRSAEMSGLLKDAYQSSYELARWSVGHAGQLGLVSNALDDGLRKIRMQPLGPFFDGFGRVLRDAARTQNKKARFQSRGRDIEVDRSVLERLRDPVIHLVRNAVAHGIEAPSAREARGKEPVGTVWLEATLVGEKVRLEVRDDGAGLDVEKVRERAVSRGILRPNEALQQDRLLEILVHPGFSTSEEVDDVAGRGIGLDVVDAAVSELGGELIIENEPGKGATFALVVPTSITTSQGLVLEAGPYRLGIQIDAVERIIRTNEESLSTVEDQEVLYHDGDPIAVTSLASLLGAPQYAPDLSSGRFPTLILRNSSQRLAVIVDDIPGETPMVVKPLGPQFERVRQFTGGAVQADGSILPVLEHRELLRRAAGQKRAAASRAASAPEPKPKPAAAKKTKRREGRATILVVDDSVTTRTLERNILEASGYRVLTATDGAEALELLQTDSRIDLVVTDLEMPRMNGLELCDAVRSGQRPELPIIIVTSRGSDEEKRAGLSAGADAYIVKGNFEQDHFMATVKRFVD